MKKTRKLFGVILIILALVVMQLPASEASAAASVSDFSINKDGVLTKYNGTSTSVTIPSGVVTIATDAFKNNDKVTSIVISDSVKKIEAYAFWNCSNLYSVSIGKGLEEIGDFAFSNCKSLESVYLPSNIKRIGIYSFQDDVNLSDITIPIETYEIHKTAFDGCKKLVIHAVEGSYADKYAKDFYERQKEFNEYEDVVNYNPDDNTTDNGAGNSDNGDTGNTDNGNSGNGDSGTSDQVDTSVGDQLSSVHVVGNKAVIFMDSSKPTVYYGNNNGNVENNSDGTTDGSGAGTGVDEDESNEQLSGLPKYTIVDGTIIADQAYYCSTKVNYVVLPDTIKEIGQFSYARSKVSTILLPEGLETISYGAFYHCDDLQYVTLPDSVMKVEPKAFEKSAWVQNFMDGEGDSDFLVSGGVLVAYRGNESAVVIPDGVRVIAAGCFAGHEEISSVSLPDSIVSIGEEAFYNCSKLSSINLENTKVQTILDRSFENTALQNVLVPETLYALGINAFPYNTSVSFEGAAPDIMHEDTAERLSNSELRKNAFVKDEKDVLVDKGELGVNVDGPEGIKAYLEGTQDYYYLSVVSISNSDSLNKALDRASQVLSGRNLKQDFVYELELTDESGIAINKLGKTALTVAIPLPSELDGKTLTIFTTDRNGQLEEITPEIISVEDVKYIRFATYHLSPFAIYETGENYDSSMIMEEETVFSAMAGIKSEPTALENLTNWYSVRKWRVILAGLMVISGMVMILARFGKRG